MRINKFIASCGVVSRRGAEELITAGRVKVNGVVVKDLSTQILDSDKVFIDGKQINLVNEKIYIILNKPKGYITSCRDEKGRKTVLHLLPKDIRVFPVGRLDYDTSGLLILTNDGDFANEIMHPSREISKVYLAEVNSSITDFQLEELAKQSDKAERISERVVQITIHEGKNRQVRKMIEAVGLETISLKRIAIGELDLGNLKVGEFICENVPPVI